MRIAEELCLRVCPERWQLGSGVREVVGDAVWVSIYLCWVSQLGERAPVERSWSTSQL